MHSNSHEMAIAESIVHKETYTICTVCFDTVHCLSKINRDSPNIFCNWREHGRKSIWILSKTIHSQYTQLHCGITSRGVSGRFFVHLTFLLEIKTKQKE